MVTFIRVKNTTFSVHLSVHNANFSAYFDGIINEISGQKKKKRKKHMLKLLYKTVKDLMVITTWKVRNNNIA